MKFWSGIFMVIAGVILGLYLGVYVMFIGGIAGGIDIIKTQNWDAMLIAINVAKVIFASAVGWLSAYMLIVPGFAMIGTSKKFRSW